VRLGSTSNGFNPFDNMSMSYSTWSVVLMPYNLPQWRYMKDPYMLLSLLIPETKAPKNKIDVYLRPLVEDLLELWIQCLIIYNALTQLTFKLYASLLWTINDFPAYENLFQWSTKEKLACPICNKDTVFRWLKSSKKMCHIRHRQFLP
jgi:hypothetical protein